VAPSLDMKEKLFLSPKLEVRTSPIEGRGVFCTDDIKKGELIEEAHLLLLKDNTWEGCDEELRRYVFPWVHLRKDWKGFCDEHGGILPIHATRPVVVLGFGMIYNHADDYSVGFVVDKHQLICSYKVNRDVESGTELTINYGEDYFSDSTHKKK
jgi:hypothetical protein